MVAYAYAAQFPRATARVVLMDAFLPGIGRWKDVWLLRDLWHFHFYGEGRWPWSRCFECGLLQGVSCRPADSLFKMIWPSDLSSVDEARTCHCGS